MVRSYWIILFIFSSIHAHDGADPIPVSHMINLFMDVWALVNVARAISYTDISAYNAMLCKKLLHSYAALLHARHGSTLYDEPLSALVSVATSVIVGVRTLCALQEESQQWPIVLLCEEIGSGLEHLQSALKSPGNGNIPDAA